MPRMSLRDHNPATLTLRSLAGTLATAFLLKLMNADAVLAATWPHFWEQYTWPHDITLRDMLTLPDGRKLKFGKASVDGKGSRPVVMLLSATGDVEWSNYYDFEGEFMVALAPQEGVVWIAGNINIPALGVSSEGVLMELDVELGKPIRAMLMD